jgi:hypothetical protein
MAENLPGEASAALAENLRDRAGQHMDLADVVLAPVRLGGCADNEIITTIPVDVIEHRDRLAEAISESPWSESVEVFIFASLWGAEQGKDVRCRDQHDRA